MLDVVTAQSLGQQGGFHELKSWDKFGARRCYGAENQENYAGVFHLLLGLTIGWQGQKKVLHATLSPGHYYVPLGFWGLFLSSWHSSIGGRNINNLRYADDTTFMTESKVELRSLLMKVKEESEIPGLKLKIQKTKIMASGPITSWQIDGETR